MKRQHGAGARTISAILDGMSSVVLFFNSGGELEYVNPAGKAMMGGEERPWRFCEVVDCQGMSYGDFLKSLGRGEVSCRFHPGFRPAIHGFSGLGAIPIDGGLLCISRAPGAAGINELLLMYKAIYQESADPMLLLRQGTWRIVSVNEAAEELTGYSNRELAEESPDLLFNPGDHVEIHQALDRIASEKSVSGYAHVERSDGTAVPVEFAVRHVEFDESGVIAMIIHDVATIERAETECRQKTSELAALNYICSTASSALDLSEVLERSIRCACEVTGLPVGLIFLIGREKDHLIPVAYQGIEKKAMAALGPIKIGECIEGRVARSGLAEIVEEQAYPPCPGIGPPVLEGLQSIAAVPIIFRGEVLGVMDLATREKRSFTPGEMSLFVSIASAIGSAIYNTYCIEKAESRDAGKAGLVGDIGKYAEELRLNYEVQRKITQSISLEETLDNIVKNVPRLLNLSSCVIFLLDEGGGGITSIKASEAVEQKFGKQKFSMEELVATKEAIERRQAVVIEDALVAPNVSRHLVRMLGARAGIVLPLIARGKVIGIMWLYDTGAPRKFTRDDVQRANLLSDQVAIAIDNAMLFTQLSRTNRQLEESYDRLKSLDTMKMEFFTLLSHELRTPLTTIKGYAELLQDGVLGPLNEGQLDKLSRINASVDRLTSIVDNLSDLSSIASKKYIVDVIPVSLNELISEVVKGISFLAESKNIRLTTDVPVGLPIIYVDRARVMQVFLNIINNAIKYTPKGGEVSIMARDEDDRVLVAIHDTGIGIPKNDLENIFSGFYHAGYKLSYEYKGVGLGLALSRGIVESHGGRIWAESEVGKGSTFYFTLPKRPLTKK
jgi:PAS domain S-box-containing protein